MKNQIPKADTQSEFTRHTPVLLQTVLQQLDLKKGQIFVDCNLGDAGHSEAVAKDLDGEITIIGFDLDKDAIERATLNLEKASMQMTSKPRIIFINDNFRNLKSAIQKESINRVDGILYDLGLSSYELELSGRGFSFKKDEPLLMTFGSKDGVAFTAEDIVNNWDEENIKTIIEAYGEDKFAWKIARAIVKARSEARITSTSKH